MSDVEREAILKTQNPMKSSSVFEASEVSPEESREFFFDIHLEDLLVECHYGPWQLSCGLEDFTEWRHPTFGRCYTFNKTEMDALGYEGKTSPDVHVQLVFCRTFYPKLMMTMLFLPILESTGASFILIRDSGKFC